MVVLHYWLFGLSMTGRVFREVGSVGQALAAQQFESYHHLVVGEICKRDWIERLVVSDGLKTGEHIVGERLLLDFQCHFLVQ